MSYATFSLGKLFLIFSGSHNQEVFPVLISVLLCPVITWCSTWIIHTVTYLLSLGCFLTKLHSFYLVLFTQFLIFAKLFPCQHLVILISLLWAYSYLFFLCILVKKDALSHLGCLILTRCWTSAELHLQKHQFWLPYGNANLWLPGVGVEESQTHVVLSSPISPQL